MHRQDAEGTPDDRAAQLEEVCEERSPHESTTIDAIADEWVAARARIAAAEAHIMRQLAVAWQVAQEQMARSSRESARREMALRSIAAQLGLEVHVNDRTVQTKMHDAFRLVTLFPSTVDTLEAGRISKAHADAIFDAGLALTDPAVRKAFEEVVLEWATHESVGRTRAYARKLAEKLDPRPADVRHADAAEERSIRLIELENGISEIVARVPTLEAHGIFDRLTRQAKAIKQDDLTRRREAALAQTSADAEAEAGAAGGAGASGANTEAEDLGDGFDDRTLDQMRADTFIDMLLTGTPACDPTLDRTPGGLGAIRAQVQISMPITTLTGVTQGGAEVDGKAPIDPATARRIAGDCAVWDRVLYDPVSAVVVAVDRYRPTPAQARFLRARDQHCRMPGCRMPARRCQIDHNHEAHEGGPTATCNLACFCVRHHTMKTETEWTVRQLPRGRLEWTSPTGRIHVDDPPPVVMFVPDDPAPF